MLGRVFGRSTASAGRQAGRRAFWSAKSATEPAQAEMKSNAAPGSLDGKIAWVIGGAGLIGTGLVHGLLRAGATVICNSRHPHRLKALTVELGHPEKLVTLQGSMLADRAEETVHEVMELTAGQLDHVVTHSAVRWWGAHRDGDETNTLSTQDMGARGSLLDLTVEEFSERAGALPQMQFAAARLLVPRLQHVPNASYTFVTGGAGEEARSPLGQINAQAVWGLAAAMRSESSQYANNLKVAEVRVGLRFNRTKEERRAEPRDAPLSKDVGRICAGIAASPGGDWVNAMHSLDSQDAVTRAKGAFPVLDEPYATFYSPESLI